MFRVSNVNCLSLMSTVGPQFKSNLFDSINMHLTCTHEFIQTFSFIVSLSWISVVSPVPGVHKHAVQEFVNRSSSLLRPLLAFTLFLNSFLLEKHFNSGVRCVWGTITLFYVFTFLHIWPGHILLCKFTCENRFLGQISKFWS